MTTQDASSLWRERWQALNDTLEAIKDDYSRLPRYFPRKETLLCLVQRLQAFAKSHLDYFDVGFSEHKLKVSDEYPPETIFGSILKQVGYDLEAIVQAMNQRSSGTLKMIATLDRADELAYVALRPAINSWLKRDAQPEEQTVLTYFQKSAHIRVIPYAPVALVAVPFTCTAVPQDYLAIPHEVGHYVFWHGKGPLQAGGQGTQIQPIRKSVRDSVKPLESWCRRWAEEIFADVYGCLIAGEQITRDFQDLLLEYDQQSFIKDDGDHPVPAIRPYIYTSVLSMQGLGDKAEQLEKTWKDKVGERNVGPESSIELYKSDDEQTASKHTMTDVRAIAAAAAEEVRKLFGEIKSEWPENPAEPATPLAKPPDLSTRADISNLWSDWLKGNPPLPLEDTKTPDWIPLVKANGWNTEGANGGYNP